MDFENMFEQIIKNPDLVTTFLPPLVDRYMPIAIAVAKEIFRAGTHVQAAYMQSDYALASAKARKVKYDAYIEAGFTEEQAMSLLLTDIRQVATLMSGGMSKSSSAVSEKVSNA